MVSLDLDKASSRSPQGERGLKLVYQTIDVLLDKSLPARGAWVETLQGTPDITQLDVAPRKGSVG